MLGRLQPFLVELRRRHVVRLGVAYVVGAVAVGGGASVFLEELAPDWVLPTVLWLLVLGLPLALALAWAYDLTPDGIERTTSTATATATMSEPTRERLPHVQPADRRRLAILPLANIHAHRDDDYFADGMTEELISVISRIRGLDVIARTTVMAYRDTTKSVSEIGQELGVGSVLEGSVRKAGDQLRITVQLIDVESQGHRWSHDYDRELREVFRIQSDIARHVADALEVTLLGREERRLDRAPTENLEAYDLYLLGRHHLNKRTDVGLRRSIDHFQQAAKLDPGFAAALAGLADAYVLAGIGYAAIPDALDHANDAALRAVELDGELPEAHTSLGYVRLNRDWDWRAAESEFERAIELNPSSAQAYQWYAHVALYRRDYDEARRRVERAVELDPLSVVLQNESGWPAHHAGDHEEALLRFRRAHSMDPSYALAHYNIGNALESSGRLEEAVQPYRRAVELSDGMPFTVSFLAAALARTGAPDEGRSLLRELLQQETDGAAISLWLAYAYEAFGDKSEALDHLERAVERREPLVHDLNTPWLPFSSLQEESRYQSLVRRVSQSWGWDPTVAI